MIEFILALVIVALVILIGWIDYNGRKERERYLNAIVAKNTEEMVNLDLAQKTKIEVTKPEKPDGVPLDELSDEEFMEVIKK